MGLFYLGVLMHSKRILFVTFVLSLCLFTATGLQAKKKKKAKELSTEELSVAMQALQEQVNQQGQTLATLGNQVNEVVSQFQLVRGQVGSNEKKNLDQDRLDKDADHRLQVLEDKSLALMSQLQELKTEGFMKPKSAARFKEYKDYTAGVEQFNSRDYLKAIKALKDFQNKNKKSIYWSYAQFWIGESYYMQSDYLTAIQEYQALLKKRPKSSKAPLALYRQGLSFVQLQSFDDAKAFFTKLTKTYPKSIEAVIAKGQIDRIERIEKLKEQQEMEMRAVQ